MLDFYIHDEAFTLNISQNCVCIYQVCAAKINRCTECSDLFVHIAAYTCTVIAFVLFNLHLLHRLYHSLEWYTTRDCGITYLFYDHCAVANSRAISYATLGHATVEWVMGC